jgi:PDZ domain-containing secreted protein
MKHTITISAEQIETLKAAANELTKLADQNFGKASELAFYATQMKQGEDLAMQQMRLSDATTYAFEKGKALAKEATHDSIGQRMMDQAEVIHRIVGQILKSA